jgi:type I restriction enzyme, S subunit
MNSNEWPLVSLGELLSRNTKVVPLVPDRRYREVTIRLWGKGVLLRGIVNGADIAADRRLEVSTGQFIVSRIDARNGAMGIVPPELDGAIVTNDFPSFNVRLDRMIPKFLGWLCRTAGFVDLCRTASEGTTNRVRLKEDRFLKLTIPLPPLEEQKGIVARVDRLAAKIDEARNHSCLADSGWQALLRSKFSQVVKGVPRAKMEIVAPLVRRKVDPKPGEEHSELGIRSFGKGSFHKPALDYISVGTKKLFRIEPGDLVFNNVFAWEGAIAVAQNQDLGRVGSHRFITCVQQAKLAVAEFLCFFFLTPEGLKHICDASPGGAGRNRTLGLEKLGQIVVPIAPLAIQVAFSRMLRKVHKIESSREVIQNDLDSMLPSILDRAFKGEL